MERDELERRLRAALDGRADVRFALMFGSAATRGPERARDVDVAVAFARPPSLWEVAHLAGALEDAVGRPVDVVDLAEATTLLRWEVLRDGRVVADRDADALADFRARVPLEWFDLEPHFVRQTEGLYRALGVPWSGPRS